MEKLKDRYLMDKLFLLLLVLQPFIDMYRAFFQDTINIFGFAIEEIINLVLIAVLVVLALIQLIQSKGWRRLLFYGGYFVFFLIYLVLHMLNSSKFDESVFSLADVSMIRNGYYVVRAYGVPIALMFSVMIHGFEDRYFSKAVKVVAFVISLVMVVTNIFKVSLVSYSLINEPIIGSIFDWGELNCSLDYFVYDLYTSKGWFYSANQMSALLFALMPFTVKEVVDHFNWKTVGLMLLQAIAMMMIGTKTAAQGAIIVIGIVMVVAIVLHYVFKTYQFKARKVIIPFFCLLMAGGSILYLNSPSKIRVVCMDGIEVEERPEDPNAPTFTGKEAMIQYIKDHYDDYYINKTFIKYYPVEENFDFWYAMISHDRRINKDNRKFKVLMSKDIVMKNDNSMDKLLGIGFTSNLLYTERDYWYQYFILGVAGTLLVLAPFFVVLLIAAYRILRRIKNLATMQNMMLGLAICVYLGVAYLAGHVLGILQNMIFLAIYCGKLYYDTKKEG